MPELDLKNPEGDWERFEADFINKVHALGGQELIDALEYDNDIPVAVLHNGPADEGVNILTRPQQMQWALNGMILNSLPRSMEEGSPRKLIADMPHTGGTVAGNRQRWATLRARYSVEKPARLAQSRGCRTCSSRSGRGCCPPSCTSRWWPTRCGWRPSCT